MNLNSIALMVSMATVLGCADTDVAIDSNSLQHTFAVAELDTPADVEHALANAINSERAIVFIHMSWAGMEPQRQLFLRFLVDYQRKFPDYSVDFHYIDCTPITSDYAPLKSLPGWPGSGHDIYAQQGTAGGGDVVWIDHGVVRHVETIFESKDTDELINKTTAFFGLEGKDT